MSENLSVPRYMPLALTLMLALVSPVTAIAQTSESADGPNYGGPARRAASRPIAVGASQDAALTVSDPKFEDNSHFQVWKFSARAGQDLVVAVESRQFDPVLMLVEARGSAGQPLQMEVADSAKIARLALRIPADGDYLIVANTLQSRRTGSYKVSLKTLADACASGGPCAIEQTVTAGGVTPINRIDVSAARAIALGDSSRSELTRSDLRLRDSSLFDAWRFEGRSGQRVVIDHGSPDFDTYLILARQTVNGPETIRENDDAPYTQNSQLAVELPDSGTYIIVATSLRSDTVGRYTVRLRSMADACADGGPCEPSTGSTQRPPLFGSVRTAPKSPIAMRDTVTARLGRGDLSLGDGTFFDAFRFTGEANQEVAAFLSAMGQDTGRFDPFLHLVRVDGDSVVVVKSDDDGGAGKNSMLTARLPRSGEYFLIANGLTVADTGAYALSLLRLSDACSSLRVCEVGAPLPQASPEATILTAAATAITLGTPVTAQIGSGTPRLPDGKPFQPWRYTARAGERVVITNHSTDFDAYLYLYRFARNSLEEIARDDDGGGGLHAQMSVELAEAGDYLVVAGSFSTSAAGEYRLTLESMSASCAAGGPCAVGETSASRARLMPAAAAEFARLPLSDTVSVELPLSAPELTGRGRFQSYRFDGRAGERVVIHMDAPGFDPYLDLALMNGSSLRPIGSDDDGGEGTNARLVAVLPENGTYLVVASALSADSARGAGPYTLAMTPCDDACAAHDGSPAVRSDGLNRLALNARRRPLPAAGVVVDSLTTDETRRSPGATFHAYGLQGAAGKTLRVSLQSSDFDPYVVLFRLEGDSLRRVESDDDGGESTSSLLEWEIDQNGTYVIAATAYSGSSAGSYMLHVEQGDASGSAPFAATVAAAAVRAQLGPALAAAQQVLASSVTMSGAMNERTPKLPGSGRFNSYRYNGTAGERVVITMEATALDPFVHLASVDGSTIRVVGTDDDGGDGMNSRLVATLPTTGRYLVVATAYASSDTARTAPYTITIAPCDDACAAREESDSAESDTASDDVARQRVLRAPRRTVQPGVALQAALVAGDSTLADGSYFHAYAINASAGSKIRVSMESSAFDAFLFLYRLQGDSLVRVAYDDDSGSDSNALIEWDVDSSGSYILVANALSRDTQGSYTLTVSFPETAGR